MVEVRHIIDVDRKIRDIVSSLENDGLKLQGKLFLTEKGVIKHEFNLK